MNEPPTPERILQTGLAFWPAKTLLSAVELGLFTELATGPATAEELQSRLGMHPRGARDFFDTLTALGFLQRERGVYSNTPETAAFLDEAQPGYIGGMLKMANHRLYPYWGRLTEALRSGQPQNEIRDGGEIFEALYGDAGKLSEFLSAMTGVSAGANRCIARQVPWEKYHTFVDAGTAQGDLAVQIALAQPHLNGTGFDLPAVEPIFNAYISKHHLEDRVRFTAGDFFADPLPKTDVVLMGHILHDWNLEEKKILVRKAFEALPDGGLLVVYDSLIDDERKENAFGLMMSLNMLVETPGGFDYTGGECIEWMREAGFRQARVEHLLGPDSMVVGEK